MTFSIEEFKQNGLPYGGARPSLFQVFIPSFPTGEEGIPSDLSIKLSFTCKAASIPPSIIDYIDVPYMSRKIKVNGDRTFPDWVVTVMNDETWDARNAFKGWHQAINSREGNRQFLNGGGLVSAYKRDLVVHQYAKTGTGQGIAASEIGADAVPIASYKIIGAFPTTVDPITLDWDAVNQIEQFDVTFAYDYWEPTSSSFGI